ncbi:S-layer homology domain-containing protein [Paenibacillus hunanensis]|uniref:S-layer homology domain-containing protein n=1 Tax=Paenibacillus hunanensis TaxID=539262 RepID=UPI002A6B0E0D|nr:S-layer homology domain-containing protein [Paenibacillus hunanensis]WPP40956.1 S-layer homology domain-containing protein [Paenibacillus hunanensis]
MKLVNRQKFIATAIILGIATTPFTSSLFSSTSTAFAAEAGTPSVTEVRTLGLMTGNAKGDFMPEKVLTRAEMAKILCNIFELDVQPASNTLYLDVSAANWSAPYIEAVQKAGYMDGTGELFHPNQAVTRQELITSLVKAMDLHSDSNNGATLSSMDVARSYGLAIADNATDANAPLNRQTSADLFIQLLDHPVGQVDAQGNTVRVGNIPYRVNGDLQGLFGVENGTVLKGAKLDIDRSQRTVTHVNTIELNSNGGVFDGKGISFNGNLTVNGSVTLKNIQSTGNLQVNGDANSTLTTQLSNSSWANVVVSSPTSMIQASGDSKIGKLTVNNIATVKTNDSASIQQLVIQSNLKQLTLDGRVDELDASQYDGNPLVTLQPSAGIGNIKLSDTKKTTDIIRNYTEQKSNVSNINGTKNTDAISSNTAATGNNINPKKKDKDKTSSIIKLDVSRLLDGIDQANDLLTHPKLMPELEELPTTWSDMLHQAVLDAKAALNQDNPTQQDINTAAEAMAKANQRYAASQNALYSYYDLFTTIRRIPINYTDAGRFDFKERLRGFGLDYYNPSTTKEQFDEYTAAIADMKMQFEQIQHIDFTELNVMLNNIYDLAHMTKDPQDSTTLTEMYYRYMDKMHKLMTQDEVNALLQQLTQEFSASGLDRPQHEDIDYHQKLLSLVNEVSQTLYNNNNDLERYMEGDFFSIDIAVRTASMSLWKEDPTVSPEQAYHTLTEAWKVFKPAYEMKLTELRNSVSEQIVQLDDALTKYGKYMPEYDAQQLSSLRSQAQNLLDTNSTSVSQLGYMQSNISRMLKNANLKDPTRLLVLIDQAKAEYQKYSKYHRDFYSQESYKDNMRFSSAINYAESIIVSENATQENIIEQEGILQMALADYSTDWITESMIYNMVSSAHYSLDRYGNPSNPYSVRLQKAVDAMESGQSANPRLTFPELRDLYVNLVDKKVAFEQHPDAVEEPTPDSSTPEGGGISDSPTTTPNDPNPSSTNEQQPSSNNEETPNSGSTTEPQAPATEEPSTGTTPVSSNEPSDQPVNNDPQPTVIEPSDQHYDYNRPPQPSEEAPAATPVMTQDPNTTETP